ncbi:MAG: DUF6597 domain-containing transcriptional factor [Pseudomonadota bacterium]
MFGTDRQLYQPLQLYHLAHDGMRCELAPPDEALRDAIYYYWMLSIEVPEVSLSVIPDGALDLVMSPQIDNFAAIYTPKDSRFVIPLEGPIVYVGVCFRVEKTQTLFHRSLSELDALEAGMGVIDSLSLMRLVERIQGNFDIGDQTAHFNTFFLEYKNQFHLQQSVNILAGVIDALEVDAVAKMAQQVGVSERQFRRVTQSLFGLRPKQIQRIVRLQEALGELLHREQQPSMTDYYDDSHRIRELKKLTGLTPGEIRRMAEKYNQTGGG